MIGQQGVGRLRLTWTVAILVLLAGVVMGQVALANETAPGSIVFTVDVSYDDGSDERQETSDSYEVTVVQVRAWEMSAGTQRVSILPGATTGFTATISNLGNAEDSIDELTVEIWNETTSSWDSALGNWSSEISIEIDGASASEIKNLGAGKDAFVTVNVTVPEDAQVDDVAFVRLKAVANEVTGDLHGIEDHPPLAQVELYSWDNDILSDQDSPQAWHVEVVHVIFTLDVQEMERYPREGTVLKGTVINPSSFPLPAKAISGDSGTGTYGIVMYIELPEGISFDLEAPAIPNEDLITKYNGYTEGWCGVERGLESLRVTCPGEFPSGAEIHFEFGVIVDEYTPPTDVANDVRYLVDAKLVYYIDDVEKQLKAVGSEASQHPGEVPEITVLGHRLVRIYDTEDGEFVENPDAIVVDEELTPGDAATITIYVKNEGNVKDTYSFDENALGLAGFEVTFICEPSLEPTGTAELEPGAVLECTLTVTVPAGTEDGAGGSGTWKAVSSDEEVESNTFTFTVKVNAPDIEANVSVWTDEDHQIGATNVKPGDPLYIRAEITNGGSATATNIVVTHNVPTALDFDSNTVKASIDGEPVEAAKIRVNGHEIVVDEIDLGSGQTLVLTYSAEVK